MDTRAQLVGISLLVVGCLVFASAAHCQVAIDHDTGHYVWIAAEGATGYEVTDDFTGAIRFTLYTDYRIPPPDHTMSTPMRVRVRGVNAGGAGPWSPWSEPAYGVPVGFHPVLPSDGFMGTEAWQWCQRAYQMGLTWP